jgi:hypothetical protein
MLKKLENLSKDLNRDGFSKEAGSVDDILNMLSKVLKDSEGKTEDKESSEEIEGEESEDEESEDEEQVEFHGDNTEHFDMCPGAVKAFGMLREKVGEDGSRDLALEALRETDELLGIEKATIESGSATLEDLEKVVELAQSVSYKAGVISKMLDIDLSDDFAFLGMHVEKVSGLTKFCQIKE